MLWFLDIAARAAWVVESYRDEAVGLMARNDQGQQAMTRVTLRPEVQFAGAQPTLPLLQDLHDRAHTSCFIANSVKTEVLCEPVVAADPQP
jgi:organic hydroperoxide reductase OsmC/OhrA